MKAKMTHTQTQEEIMEILSYTDGVVMPQEFSDVLIYVEKLDTFS